ncbi:MAG: hypothetical protein R3F62_23975 [Planctomycetota bacterium]
MEDAASTPSPAPETPAPSETEDDANPGVDKVLVGLCVGAWILAMVLLAWRLPGIRVNWELGNLKQALDTGDQQQVQASVEALVDLADSNDVVSMVRDELVEGARFDAIREDKVLFRLGMLRVLEQVPGEDAQQALLVAAEDPDARVRRMVYVLLHSRAKREFDPPAEVANMILDKANYEQDLVSRAVAMQQVRDLGGMTHELEVRVPGAWPFIQGLRNNRLGDDGPPVLVRRACTAGVEAVVGDGFPDGVPYDPEAPLATRDASLEALEAWFDAHGGERPEGTPSHAEWKASLAQDTEPGAPEDAGEGK